MNRKFSKILASVVSIALAAAMIPMTVMAAESTTGTPSTTVASQADEPEKVNVVIKVYRNGDTANVYKTASFKVAKGSKLDEPEISDYYSFGQGFKFEGWFNDGGWNNYLKNGSATAVNFDDFKANGWTNLHCMVTDYQKVQYFLTENDKADNKVYASDKALTNGSVTEPAAAPVREGYTFNYWYKEGQSGKNYFTSDQKVNGWTNLIASWTINKYNVTFDSDGGSAVDAQQVEWNQTAAEPAAPTRDGYVFKGWYTSDDKPYDFKTPVKDNVALKAKWSKIETVEYYLTPEDRTANKVYSTDKVINGDMVTAPAEIPVREGYTFQYWYKEGQEGQDYFKSNQTANGWTVLIASWKVIPPAKPTNDQVLSVLKLIKLDCSDCVKVGYKILTEDDIVSTSDVTLEDGKYTATVTVSGKTAFQNWYWYLHNKIVFADKDTATVKLTLQDGKWTAESGVVEITVKHAPKPVVYKVDFDSKGGTNVLARYAIAGQKVNAPSDPIRLGYRFEGWYTKDGVKYDFSKPVESNITLEAHWKKTSICDSIISWF